MHDDVRVRITEVEAYLADHDPGSHAFRGRTPRNAVMFSRPGLLYTYFSYGMHTCANVVCSPEGTAAAVLLRAGEIVDGIDIARMRRPGSRGDAQLASGPARLTIALGIPLSANGTDLLAGGSVRLEGPFSTIDPVDLCSGPRVGVAGEGGSQRFPWRWWIRADSTVSAYRRHVPRRRSAP